MPIKPKVLNTPEDALLATKEIWEEIVRTGKDKWTLLRDSELLGVYINDCPLCDFVTEKENLDCVKCPGGDRMKGCNPFDSPWGIYCGAKNPYKREEAAQVIVDICNEQLALLAQAKQVPSEDKE